MTAAAQDKPQGYAVEQYVLAAGVALLAGVYLFSPLASYVGGLLFLTLFSKRLYRVVRVAAGVVTILSGASIWASRTFGQSLSDDFQEYYEIYSRIDHHQFTTGVIPVYELGLPAFFKFISLTLPSLSPSGLMFILATTAGLILLLYVERFGLSEFAREKKGYGVAMVFLFFSFVMVTQLTRQMLSSVLLVYLFFAVGPLWKRLSLLLSSAIHLTALAVHAVVRALQGRYLILPLLIVGTIIVARYVDLETIATAVTGYDIPRLGYYLTAADTGGNLATLAIVLFVAVAGALSLLALKASRQPILANERRAMMVLAGVIVVYLLTLNVTLLPFRLFLVIHAVMAGWFFAFFTRRFPLAYLVIGGAALIFYRTRTLYIIDPASAFVPWGVYGAFGELPGYFFLSYLAA